MSFWPGHGVGLGPGKPSDMGLAKGNGELTGLVLPLLAPLIDDGGEMEAGQSSPKTNTSPFKLGVVGVGMLTNGDCRLSMLGVGDGGELPTLDMEPFLESLIGRPISSALCTKWHLGPYGQNPIV